MQRIRYQAARVELASNDSSGSPATFSAVVARPRISAAPKTEPKILGRHPSTRRAIEGQ
jgi:hypothetical protein